MDGLRHTIPGIPMTHTILGITDGMALGIILGVMAGILPIIGMDIGIITVPVGFMVGITGHGMAVGIIMATGMIIITGLSTITVIQEQVSTDVALGLPLIVMGVVV